MDVDTRGSSAVGIHLLMKSNVEDDTLRFTLHILLYVNFRLVSLGYSRDKLDCQVR